MEVEEVREKRVRDRVYPYIYLPSTIIKRSNLKPGDRIAILADDGVILMYRIDKPCDEIRRRIETLTNTVTICR